MVAENRRLAAPAERRLAADERDAGGPRLDGLGRGAQAARARSPTSRRILAVELVCAARGARPARAARAGGGHRRRARARSARRRRRARARTAGSRPSWPRPSGLIAHAATLGARPSRRDDRGAASERAAPGPGAARDRALLPGLAAGGGAADADEQPRPRGRRATRRPRRLRRHRPGGPLLGRLRRDRRARCATLGDDETLLVQSGKPVGVFRTHEWAPRVLIANSNLVAGLGQLGRVPPPRGARADDVRPDDRRARGSTSARQGILQGTYECFAEIARRRFGGSLAGTITLTAGPRRHGRRAAAGGHDERRRRALHRGRPERIDGAGSRPATSTRWPTTSTTRSPAAWRPSASGAPLSVGLVGNAADVAARAPAERASRPTSSPTRPAPTTR